MTRYLVLLSIVVFSFCTSSIAQNKAKFSDIKPGMTDAKLEKMAVKLANKRGMVFNWHEVYYKAVILSKNWELDLDRDGFLKGRKIHMQLLAILPSGRCATTDFTFKQKLLHNEKFSSALYYDRVSDLVYVDCE